MDKFLLGIVGTLISIGIGALIRGQRTIKNDAKEGRKILHDKMDDTNKKLDTYIGKVDKLETAHKINHPGQL